MLMWETVLRLARQHKSHVGVPWDMLIYLFILVAVAVLWGNPYFFANDDFYPKYVLGGSITGGPEAELVFVSRLIGIPLAELSAVFPDFPIYDWALLSTNAFAFVLLAFAWRGSFSRRVGWYFFASIVFVWLIQAPTFTTTALFSSSVAAILLAESIYKRQISWRSLPAIGLLFLGIAWRSDAVIPSAVTGVAVLLALHFYWLRQDGRPLQRRPQVIAKTARSVLAFLGVIFAATAPVVWFANNCVGLEPSSCAAWVDFREYNSMRGQIHGSALGEELEAQADANETWAGYEIDQFLNFYYFDQDTFGPAKLEAVREGLDASQLYSPLNLLAAVQTAVEGILGSGLGLTLALLGGPTLLISVALDAAPWRKARALVIAAAGPAAAIIGAGLIRLPDRVLIPLLFAGLLAVVAIATTSAPPDRRTPRIQEFPIEQKTHKVGGELEIGPFTLSISPGADTAKLLTTTKRTTIAVLTLILIFHHAFSPTTGFVGNAIVGAQVAASTARSLDQLATIQQEARLFFFAGSGVFGGSAYVSPAYGQPDNVIVGGWPTFSPHWETMLRAKGLPSRLTHDHFLNGTVAFVGTREQARSISQSASERIACGVAPVRLREWAIQPELSVWGFKAVQSGNCQIVRNNP